MARFEGHCGLRVLGVGGSPSHPVEYWTEVGDTVGWGGEGQPESGVCGGATNDQHLSILSYLY